MSKTAYIIRNGTLLDPSSGRQEQADLFIEDGVIVDRAPTDPCETIDASGLHVAPGLIDIHVHFREPGHPDAETLETGAQSAARSGFSTVVTMPNTLPPIDSPEWVRHTINRSNELGLVDILPSASITLKRAGKLLSDLPALKAAGAVAFTDDGSTVFDDAIMEAGMRGAATLKIPLLDHALDPYIAGSGVLHEGTASRRLEVKGIPSEAERRIVDRNIGIARRTGTPIHIQHISTAEGVTLVREAQRAGHPVTAEVTPHHVYFCDEDIEAGRTDFKVNPPIRSAADRAAIVDGVVDGTIAAFATDHAPHSAELKAKGFSHAPFGAIGMETAIGSTYCALVKNGRMSLMEWLRRWTTGPAAIINQPAPSLRPGAVASLIVMDLVQPWVVRAADFASKSRNCPWEGLELIGRNVLTFHRGSLVWRA